MTIAARVPISFTLDAGMFAGIEKRAKTMGKKPADYVRSLAEAAYAARVGAEKNMPASDHDLDQAVRAVFCLAGEFQPSTIAKATGLGEDLVRDVLRGLRQVAGEISERPKPALALPGPAAASALAGTEAPTKTGAMDADEIAVIRNMWREGKSVAAIADTLGRALKSVANFTARNREVCPFRRGGDA